EDVILLEADGQVAKEFPAAGAAGRGGIGFKAVAGPETRLLGPAVEIERLVKDGKVVVAHEGDAAAIGDDVQALHGVRAIANDVAKADDIGDAAAVDLGKDGGERLEVGVNVTDDGEHRYRSLGNNPRLRSENGK